ncbi:hypothetical protein AOQ84DRAFT_320397 [Glonium stellatum]|uniref:Uncharacterized protein n=1 Tax=Glonium stellatum TaxID=574774 RepID=A0A8E2EYC0_9PEZI|nr:hypothetical protein AOQ84DRAFT_320397 [Glonium stellatum]
MAIRRRSEIIRSNPIDDGLKSFCVALNSSKLGISATPNIINQSDSEELKNIVVDLTVALQKLPAARLLPSVTGRGTLRSDLLRLGSSVDSDDFSIERIIPLLKAVLSAESDEVIWDNVYTAVAESTPPPRPVSSTQ